MTTKPFCSLINFLQKYQYVLPKKTRMLGLDVGSRYVGVAVSDHRFRKALPTDICLIRAKNDNNLDQIHSSLNQLCQEHKSIALVVGVPTMNEARVNDICNFIQELSAKDPDSHLYNIPVLLQDETYSTFESYQILSNGKSLSKENRNTIVHSLPRNEKEMLDRISAATILQRTLDDMNSLMKQHKIMLKQQQEQQQKQQKKSKASPI